MALSRALVVVAPALALLAAALSYDQAAKAKLKIAQGLAGLWLGMKDPGYLAATCGELAGYGFQGGPELQNWMVRLGGISLGLEAMKTHAGQPMVQAVCGSMLGGMSLFNYDNSVAIGQAGAIDQALGAMRVFPHIARVQHLASAIGCFNDLVQGNRQHMGRLGGVEVTLAAIRNHYGDGEVLFHAYCLFSNGLMEPENAAAMMQGGGINLTLSVMRDHGKSPRVREECLQALRGLARHTVTRQASIEAGALDMIMLSLREATQDGRTQSAGMGALTNFAVFEADAVAAAGGAEAATAALREQRRMAGAGSGQYGAITEQQVWPVVLDACRLLAGLSRSPASQAAVVEAGAVEQITLTLWSLPGFHDARGFCCVALMWLGQGNATQEEIVRRSGAPDCTAHKFVTLGIS